MFSHYYKFEKKIHYIYNIIDSLQVNCFFGYPKRIGGIFNEKEKYYIYFNVGCIGYVMCM